MVWPFLPNRLVQPFPRRALRRVREDGLAVLLLRIRHEVILVDRRVAVHLLFDQIAVRFGGRHQLAFRHWHGQATVTQLPYPHFVIVLR